MSGSSRYLVAPSWWGEYERCWRVRDRTTARLVAVFFTRWRAREYRDWLNEKEEETEFHYDPELKELCGG